MGKPTDEALLGMQLGNLSGSESRLVKTLCGSRQWIMSEGRQKLCQHSVRFRSVEAEADGAECREAERRLCMKRCGSVVPTVCQGLLTKD